MSNVEVNANTNANPNKKQETRNSEHSEHSEHRIRRECQMQIWIQIQQGNRLCKTSAGEEPKIIVALKGQR
jgi:hypothetical protein